MFLGNTDKVRLKSHTNMQQMRFNMFQVYIMDKSEGNAIQIDGHPAWGSVYDLTTNVATTVSRSLVLIPASSF